MQVYNNPKQENWTSLCKRPKIETSYLEETVRGILKSVKLKGDKALRDYAKKFDAVQLNEIQVSTAEIQEASVSTELKRAIQVARENIEAFHASQELNEQRIETSPGVYCWRRSVGIEKVGLYIPGGTAPLFSTILMLAIPAKLAGCKELILCTPPNKEGNIHPAILYTANLLGIDKVFKVGGAQAIGAMAYGTESIPAVYKIFGPGNQYVTKAKEFVQQSGVAIDMPAGPSELLVIADETCQPAFVAADLLSQAEHGEDSQVVLLSNSKEIIEQTLEELVEQVVALPRRTIAEEALKNSKAILLDSMESCLSFSNLYAPEHLIVASDAAACYASLISNAGSVFLGNYSCESAGDYASGTNHTLPTNAFARNYSGVSLDSFVKKITYQELTPKGLQNLGPSIEEMAVAEELFAHKNAVSIRLKYLENA